MKTHDGCRTRTVDPPCRRMGARIGNKRFGLASAEIPFDDIALECARLGKADPPLLALPIDQFISMAGIVSAQDAPQFRIRCNIDGDLCVARALMIDDTTIDDNGIAKR